MWFLALVLILSGLAVLAAELTRPDDREGPNT